MVRLHIAKIRDRRKMEIGTGSHLHKWVIDKTLPPLPGNKVRPLQFASEEKDTENKREVTETKIKNKGEPLFGKIIDQCHLCKRGIDYERALKWLPRLPWVAHSEEQSCRVKWPNGARQGEFVYECGRCKQSPERTYKQTTIFDDTLHARDLSIVSIDHIHILISH